MPSSDYIRFQALLANIKTSIEGVILGVKIVFMIFFLPSVVLFLLLALNFMLDR